MKNKLILWLGLIFLILLGWRIFSKVSAPKKIIEKERIIPVVVSFPTFGQIQDKLVLTGDIAGETEVAVRPKTVGRVEEIYVKEGDLVKAGQPLMSYVAGIKPDNELYQDLVTFAPISGIVGMQLVKIGEQVTSQPGGLSPVFYIYKINSVKALVNISEKNYQDIYFGMPAEIELDAWPGQKFSGKINKIRPVMDPLSRTTAVEILIANPDFKIKPGMFGRISLILKSKNNVMLLPADCVLGEGEKYVFVAEGGRAVKKIIQTGLKENNTVEITGGLTEKDEIITVGQRVVEDGSSVEVKTND